MMKIISVLVLVVLNVAAFSQNIRKAEESALNCLNSTLNSADKDVNYILNTSREFNDLLSQRNVEAFEVKKREVDSIFALCGLYESNHLNFALLSNCMQSSYEIKSNDNDTATSYHQLLVYINYINKNPSIFSELSPSLHSQAIKSVIPPENIDKDFYKVISFILFQGIAKEIDNYATKAKNENNEQKTFEIVDDDEEADIIKTIEVEGKPKQPKCVATLAKDQMDGSVPIYKIVEEMPDYHGGYGARAEYLTIKSSGVEGKVFVKFVIDTTGKILDPKIARGLDPVSDNKALELIKNMPDWIPGKHEGENVYVEVIWPVRFEK